MNSLWNFLDWLFPSSIRLPDDLAEQQDIEASSTRPRSSTTSSYSSQSSSTISSPTQYAASSKPPSSRSYHHTRPPLATSIMTCGTRSQERLKVEDERIVALKAERTRLKAELDRCRREKDEERQTQRKNVEELQKELESLKLQARKDEAALAFFQPRDSIYRSAIPATPPPDYVPLRDAFTRLVSEYANTCRRLDDQTRFLRDQDQYLSKVDDYTGRQIIEELSDLNSEISNFACIFSEDFHSHLSAPPKPNVRSSQEAQAEVLKARSKVEGRLGLAMVTWLQSTRHLDDLAIVVQLAAQAWLVVALGKAFDSFCFGLPVEADQCLNMIYNKMFEKSRQQGMAARWRAFSHEYARELITARFEPLELEMMKGLLAIFVVSGVPASEGNATLQQYRGQLQHILKRAESLSTKLKESMMSANFEVSWINPVSSSPSPNDYGRGSTVRVGERFDREKMEDVYDSVGSRAGDVMCTVGFGLRTVRKVDMAKKGSHSLAGDSKGPTMNGIGNGHNGIVNGHTKSRSGDSSGVKAIEQVVIKPKVLLDYASSFYGSSG